MRQCEQHDTAVVNGEMVASSNEPFINPTNLHPFAKELADAKARF